jgi:hypothetical protein
MIAFDKVMTSGHFAQLSYFHDFREADKNSHTNENKARRGGHRNAARLWASEVTEALLPYEPPAGVSVSGVCLGCRVNGRRRLRTA